ncbi:MAG: hypothetical protein ACHP65_00145 [Legionellales bacterium]
MQSRDNPIQSGAAMASGAEPPRLLIETTLATPLLFSGVSPSFFTTKDLYNLSLTSKTFRQLASDNLACARLLKHVILGDEGYAQDMIEANPTLLFMKTSAQDYSGRTIIATPFQGAIGAGDTSMWKMMLPHLDIREALRQFREWFPNGIETTPAADLQAIYNEIARAIINGDAQGRLAIEEFRQIITSPKEITHGHHFNLQHLLAAYQAYIDNFYPLSPLGNWDNLDLFWKQVIGYVQRQMTAYDAQMHCSGVHSVLDTPRLFRRLLKLSGGEEFFSPLLVNSGLGFDFAVFSYYSRSSAGVRWSGWHSASCEKLCRAKTNELAGLRESLEQGMRYQP